MKNVLILIGILFTLNMNAQKVPTYSYEQFTTNISTYSSGFNHDETKLLIGSDVSGVYNVHSIDLKTGETTQLTNSTSSAKWASRYMPYDNGFLFSGDHEGNEVYRIYMQTENGENKELTPDTSKVNRYNYYGLSRSKKSFYMGSTKRTGQFVDLYEFDLESMKSELIYENPGKLEVYGVADNNQYFILNETITTSNNNFYLYNRTSKESKLITKHEGTVSYRPCGFSKDSNYFFFTSDEGREFPYLVRYNIETGEQEVFLEEKDASVAYAYTSYNEKYRVVGIDKNAQTTLKIFDVATGKEVNFPNLPAGEIGSVSISESETKMVFSITSPKQPSNLYLYDIEKGTHQQLTNNLNPEINPDHLVKPEHITFPSFDEMEIPSVLYKPHQATKDNKVPAMLMIHGGPGGQSRMGYNSVAQFLANHGYVIIAVNNRGSSGYGKTFFQADNRKHGEADLMDCVMSKKYLESLGYVDMDKVGIMGGSYGGYMTLAALTYHPNEFEVGVDIFGPSNWVRTLKNVPPWWAAFKEALYDEMGDPNVEADAERLHKISPLFHAHNIVKPLMVLQGANDPRVLQVESDEIVEAVKKNNVPVEYIVFEDEGHGFLKAENEIKGYESVLKFLDTHLKNK